MGWWWGTELRLCSPSEEISKQGVVNAGTQLVLSLPPLLVSAECTCEESCFAHVAAYEGQRLAPGVFLNYSSRYFLRHGLCQSGP